MTVGELKKALEQYDNKLELVGDVNGAQDDVWKVCFGQEDDNGVFRDVDIVEGLEDWRQKAVMICAG